VGWLPKWPGLAHEVALPPLDFLADVRLLMARAHSVPVFAIGVVAALVIRAAILAAILGFTRTRFGFALRFYLAALAPAFLASGLDFSGRAILYAYLIWAGLLVTVVTFGALGAAPWMGSDRLSRALADSGHYAFRLGPITAYLIALTIVGVIGRNPGGAGPVLIVPISGALTAFMVWRLSVPPNRRLSFGGFAITAVAAVVIIVAITVVIRGNDHPTTNPRTQRGSLVLVPGVDTSTGNGALFKLDPRTLGFSCRQTYYYSYRGLGSGGKSQGEAWCPIRTGAPYTKADTTRPLQLLTTRLRAQIALLPRPVTIVTHSQGAWIAWSEITEDGDASPVRALVMLAPFNEGLAPYPPTGHSGAGAAGGAAARIVTNLGRWLGINQFDPDAPLARQLQGTSGAVGRLVGRPLPPRVRGLAVLARIDLPLEPRPWPHQLPEACPGWLTHAALPTSARVATTVVHFLHRDPVDPCPDWILAIGHATEAFGAPSPAA
jgi:hypothetical protein